MSESLRIGFVSMHTSPADLPGSGDAGGMNVVEYHQAFALAELGHRVDLITRRSDPGQADVVELSDRVRLLHLPAGPATKLAKSLIDAHIDEFSTHLGLLQPYDVLHSHHWMSGVAALPVARAWGVPHLQSFHSVAALPGSALSDGEPPESPARVPGERLVIRLMRLDDKLARRRFVANHEAAMAEVQGPEIAAEARRRLEATVLDRWQRARAARAT